MRCSLTNKLYFDLVSQVVCSLRTLTATGMGSLIAVSGVVNLTLWSIGTFNALNLLTSVGPVRQQPHNLGHFCLTLLPCEVGLFIRPPTTVGVDCWI